MGFIGTFFVTSFVAWASMFFSFAARTSWRGRLLIAVVAGSVAILTKFAGNASGLFLDGELAEWLATNLAAIVAVLILGTVAAS